MKKVTTDDILFVTDMETLIVNAKFPLFYYVISFMIIDAGLVL